MPSGSSVQEQEHLNKSDSLITEVLPLPTADCFGRIRPWKNLKICGRNFAEFSKEKKGAELYYTNA